MPYLTRFAGLQLYFFFGEQLFAQDGFFIVIKRKEILASEGVEGFELIKAYDDG